MELNHNNKRFLNEDLRTVLEKFYSVDSIRALFALTKGNAADAKGKHPKKAEMVDALLETSDNDAAGRAFFESLSPAAQRAYAFLVWNKHVNMATLEAAADARIAEPLGDDDKRGRRYPGYTVSPEFDILVHYVTGHYGTAWDYHWSGGIESTHFAPRRIAVMLPPAVKKWFRSFLPKPPHYELIHLDEPPVVKGQTVRVFRGAEDAVLGWRLAADAILRKTLPLTTAGNPTKAAMRKLVKSSTAREFFNHPGDPKELCELRHECLFALLTQASRVELETLAQRPFPAEQLFAKIVPALLRQPGVIAPAVPHLIPPDDFAAPDKKGLRALSDICAALPVGKWISAENIIERVHLRDVHVAHLETRHITAKVYRKISFSRRENHFVGERIDLNFASPEDFDSLVVNPLLQGVPFLLAAGGLLDIAYTPPPTNPQWHQNGKVDYLTPFAGLVAVRLNAIGAYAFGLAKKLDLGIEETPECTIHYSPEKLVAIAKNLDPVTERILTEHLERLSPTVYRLTRKSLFGKVTTPRELADRVKAFRDHLPGEPPPNWEAFLKECLSTPPPLTKRNSTMIIYTLSEDPEVRRLFATDEVLKRLTSKVEGWRVAIDLSDINRVRARLREFGYLLNLEN
ncbi:MAG: hypothetical protein JJT96_05210 [Opitutales bacterium]|nr:hypothetical protein [Opitutales bacterium]